MNGAPHGWATTDVMKQAGTSEVTHQVDDRQEDADHSSFNEGYVDQAQLRYERFFSGTYSATSIISEIQTDIQAAEDKLKQCFDIMDGLEYNSDAMEYRRAEETWDLTVRRQNTLIAEEDAYKKGRTYIVNQFNQKALPWQLE